MKTAAQFVQSVETLTLRTLFDLMVQNYSQRLNAVFSYYDRMDALDNLSLIGAELTRRGVDFAPLAKRARKAATLQARDPIVIPDKLVKETA